MKYTTLIEFADQSQNIIRGVLLSTSELADKIVVCVHGFERSAVTEKKFKTLADELIIHDYASFRFDFAGCGVSDGQFRLFTIADRAHTLKIACDIALKYGKKLVLVGHSLGACVIVEMLSKYPQIKPSGIILFGPALNQKELLRYYFTIETAKGSGIKEKITWDTWKKYFNEDLFVAQIENTERMTGSNFISTLYLGEVHHRDYSKDLTLLENILLIQGDCDQKVPFESLSINFPNKIIVAGGDHDLERPDMMRQWLEQAKRFVIEKA